MAKKTGSIDDPSELRPAVFLDRDGCVIHEDGWVTSPEQIRLIDGAAETIRALRDRGFLTVLITNQSAVARGLIDEKRLAEIHARLEDALLAKGARLDAIYYCPHHPEGEVQAYAISCRCRKPGTGMIEQATQDLGIDLPKSFVIGDDFRDVALAPPFDMGAVLVRTGKGASREDEARRELGNRLQVIDSIAGAATIIERDPVNPSQ